jgi:hypothetical protein
MGSIKTKGRERERERENNSSDNHQSLTMIIKHHMSFKRKADLNNDLKILIKFQCRGNTYFRDGGATKGISLSHTSELEMYSLMMYQSCAFVSINCNF